MREGGAEVRILGAAITRIPAGVDRKVHQVGEPPNLLCAVCLAAGQSAEGIEIDGISADREQISIEEFRVALFISCVRRDVLRAIGIEVHEGGLIAVHRLEWSCLHGELAGGEAAEFGILLPQVGLNELSRSHESQDGHITRGNDAGGLGGGLSRSCRQQGTASKCCSSHADSF